MKPLSPAGVVTDRGMRPADDALLRIAEPTRPPRVLLVEDDPDVRRVLGVALRRAGMVVLEAETAAEARGIFDATAADLIVTDVALPGDMDGFAFGAWLRICFGNVPVIYITGLVGWEWPMLPRQDRITMLVRKPFGARVIVEAVNTMLGRAHSCCGEHPGC